MNHTKFFRRKPIIQTSISQEQEQQNKQTILVFTHVLTDRMIDKVHVKEHQLSCKFPDNMVYAHDKIIITVTVRVIQISLFLNALMIIKLIME